MRSDGGGTVQRSRARRHNQNTMHYSSSNLCYCIPQITSRIRTGTDHSMRALALSLLWLWGVWSVLTHLKRTGLKTSLVGSVNTHTHTQNVAASFYCTHSSPGAQAKRSNASFSMFGLIVKTLVCKNNNNYVTKSLVWNNQLNISSLCMKPMY